mmetsp:Transcript_27984/g.59686  ORF Transcript_27984/g.59686 Transcript_27984/m.59686 type:complete len:126 (+) Transcript_27984:197-574(+)
MVGRLSPEDRETVAEIILALSNKDKTATAKLYQDNGYKATFRDDDAPLDDAILHRFASFHLDRIDLSPLTLDNGERQLIPWSCCDRRVSEWFPVLSKRDADLEVCSWELMHKRPDLYHWPRSGGL